MLLDNVYVLPVAHILKHFRPDGCGDFADVGFFENEHKGSRLAYATTNAEWDVAVDDGFVVREVQEVELSRHFELDFECVGVDAYSHTGQLVTSFCDGIPDEDVAI